MRHETDAESVTEVIRRALAVYDAVWKVKTEGGDIVIRHGGKDMPLFLI